ncbi:MAG: VWA domain-containing protein [Armatimonadetes bacterium]|nr:VWA domain-containing protein [Armatimonadota bacterium]
MSTRACLIVLLLAVLAAPARAQLLIPRPLADQPDLPPLECIEQNVTVSIEQQVARVTVEQVFRNSTGQDLEAVYFLPLHESASISRFSYWVKGREIRGTIQEKEQAREAYERVVASRRDPGLLEQAGRNLFRVNLFPISPSEPMRVVVEYSQLCPYEQGVVRFRYPLTAAGAEQTIGSFRLEARVADQKPIDSLLVSSHGGARAALDDPHHGSISFGEKNFKPRTDFAFEYRLKSQDFGVSFLTHRKPGQDGYFMLIVAPQEETTRAQVVQKDVIFVFDKSGSMEGEKIEQAKAALAFCIRKLGPDDRFRVITFSDTVESSSGQLVPAAAENLQKSLGEVSRVQALGGTNIHQALKTAMGGFEPGPRQKVILFMTDGLPTVGETDIGKIVAEVSGANRNQARLFAFGVGDDLDDYLLLKLATDNRGALQYVRAGESIESKISSFFAKISTPVLVNLQVDFGAARTGQLYPPTLPDVFKGSQLILVGRYASAGPQEIVLTGDINGQKRTFRYPAVFPQEQAQNPFLERLWAKQRVDWAVDQMRLHGENPELKNEVIALSKQFMFMTPYTSFLAMPKEERDRLAASSSTGYPTGADPILAVLAPREARVAAFFPWGEARALVFEPASGLWKCRFIIPKGVSHGPCEVVVVITYPDGRQQRQLVCFEADNQPPTGEGVAALVPTPQGWSVRLEVAASSDTRRVLAHLGGDRWLELSRDARGRWTGSAPVRPLERVSVTLMDHGHNRTTMELEVRR